MIDKQDYIVVVENAKSKRKHYRMACDKCYNDRGYQRVSRHGLGLCKVCAPSHIHKGKIVSQETRAKMKQNNYISNGGTHPWTGKHHNDDTKNILSKKQSEYCKQHGNQFIGHKHTSETIARISELNSGKEPRWKGRIFQYSGPKGYFKMRSSYELEYAKWMDINNINWEYEPKFKLSNGKTFSPDFRLVAYDTIVEIKGYWTKTGLEKWAKFCEDYPNINKKVLMKRDLLQLGLEIK
jgi:ribosomal protein S14